MANEDGRPEEMAAFFDLRAEGYDAHMRATVEDFDAFYGAVASAVEPTRAPVRILDLGVGTGAELDSILVRAPHARITAVDVSQAMLDRLKKKHARFAGQLELICASFTEVPLGEEAYDYVVSVMALHHHLPRIKLALYRKVYDALRAGGQFVNGDYVADELDDEAASALRRLSQRTEAGPPGGYHIDLPLPVDTERSLLGRAGFAEIYIPFCRSRAAVFVARRA